MTRRRDRYHSSHTRRHYRARLLDFSLGFLGLSIAALSAYLPVYVYQNSGSFSPPRLVFSGRSDVIPAELSADLSTAGRFLDRIAGADIDSITTGSIRPAKKRRVEDAPLGKPSSDNIKGKPDAVSLSKRFSRFELVFAFNGRALVRDGDDLIPVAIGSRLPDGSKVKSLTRKSDGWQLLTTRDAVLSLKP